MTYPKGSVDPLTAATVEHEPAWLVRADGIDRSLCLTRPGALLAAVHVRRGQGTRPKEITVGPLLNGRLHVMYRWPGGAESPWSNSSVSLRKQAEAEQSWISAALYRATGDNG
jgi:hypothetical protein